VGVRHGDAEDRDHILTRSGVERNLGVWHRMERASPRDPG
jgi:hypothetical protein